MIDKKDNGNVVIDTNLLLDDSKILYKLSKTYNQIIIPITVLKELDMLKFRIETAFSAREAIRAIREFKSTNPDRIHFDLTEIDVDKDTGNDAKIIRSVKNNNATIATKDVSMQLIAEAQGLETLLYDSVINNLFRPYVYIEQDLLFQTFNEGTFGYARTFGNGEYHDFLKVTSKLSGRSNINKDTWFFVIINTPMESTVVYAHNPTKHIFQKIDDDPNYCVIDNNKKTSKIKARDIYQKCAIYALKEAQHVLITGKYGTGKSLIATSAALASSEDKKLFVSRAPIGLNSKYNIGFMPGDAASKMSDWLAGFMSALYYLYANTKGQGAQGGYDYVRDVLFREKMEPIPINTIQGLSLLDNDVLIVDETQLIDVSTISMILSRPSKTGRLILLGDLAQTYDVVKPAESGLLKLLRVLPHKSMAYVDLQTSYRSDIIELADLLQDKTIG